MYVAEQKEPVKRRGALKIIKLGMDTKQVIARFEAERQVLAMMDHPNIATVHRWEEVERITATGSLNEGSKGVVMLPRIDVHGHGWIINRQTATRICAGLPEAPQTAVSVIVEDNAEQQRWDENRVASTITVDGHDGLIGSSSCRVQKTLNGGRRDGWMVGRMKQHRRLGIDTQSCSQAEPN